MTLQEVKLVLTWVEEKLNKAVGAKHSRPDEFKKAYDEYKVVENLYNSMCEELLTQIKEK
jgi:hypothetical protein